MKLSYEAAAAYSQKCGKYFTHNIYKEKWWGNTQGRDQWESWALRDMQAGDAGTKTSITRPLTRHSREPQQMRLLGNQAMLGGERGHRFLTLITRRNLNCNQERRSISGKGNLHAKAKTWNEAKCSQDKQDAGENFLLLCSWSVGNEMARKEESGSGPHCEGPRVSEKDQSKEGSSQPQEQTRWEGTQESTEWDRIPPLF